MQGIPNVDAVRNQLSAPPNITHGRFRVPGVGTSTPVTGQFIVPDGVFTLWISMCAGGGAKAAGTGGNTTFGSLTCTGGAGNGGAAGTPNGFPQRVTSITDNLFFGGDSPFGRGGGVDVAGQGYGAGAGSSNNVNPGGSGGGWYLNEPYPVVPGQVIDYSIGQGGAPGTIGGQPGILYVEW